MAPNDGEADDKAERQQDYDAHPLLTAPHVDGLREAVRQLNWAAREFSRNITKVTPIMLRLADELELARRGTLKPEPPTRTQWDTDRMAAIPKPPLDPDKKPDDE